jgi:hypothetical protein
VPRRQTHPRGFAERTPKTEAASRIVPMTPRLRGILQRRWEKSGKQTAGWISSARKSTVGHIVPNTIYQSHPGAVRAAGFVTSNLCCTRSGTLVCLGGVPVAWMLGRWHVSLDRSIKQSMTYVHPTDRPLHAAIGLMSELPSAGAGDKSGTMQKCPFLAASPVYLY